MNIKLLRARTNFTFSRHVNNGFIFVFGRLERRTIPCLRSKISRAMSQAAQGLPTRQRPNKGPNELAKRFIFARKR